MQNKRKVGSSSYTIQSSFKYKALIYALPTLPLSFLFGPIAIVQGIYATHFGISLSTIAAVLLVSRVFDAITDPIIGHYSDKFYINHGTRKRFIFSGGILFIASSWFLYAPPHDVTPMYFLASSLTFYLAYTIFEIPHLAWGGQLVGDSKEKNKIYGMRSLCMLIGGLLFFVMPMLPIFDSNEFTPETLKWSVFCAALFMLPMLYLCVTKVPDSYESFSSEQSLNRGRPSHQTLSTVTKSIIANKPLLMLTAAQMCTGFGSHMWFTLLFLFVDSYLSLGSYFAKVYVISFAFSIVSLRLWYKLALRWGKQFTWAVGMLAVLIGLIMTGLLSTEQSSLVWLQLSMICISAGFSAFSIMVPSLLSDIVDYGTWKFGGDRAGTYFSLYTLINKTVSALGGAVGLFIAHSYGFDPTNILHSDSTIFGLRLGISWIPAFMIVASVFIIMQIPINARKHSIIRRRLDAQP